MKKPIIHIHIGSLIEKFSIEVRPSTEKTHEDLSHLLLNEYPKIQEQVSEALTNALNNSLESFRSTLAVDEIQKKVHDQS